MTEHGTLQLIEATADAYRLRSSIVLAGTDGPVELEYPAWAAPVLARGLLYARGKNRLVCAELIPQQ